MFVYVDFFRNGGLADEKRRVTCTRRKYVAKHLNRLYLRVRCWAFDRA